MDVVGSTSAVSDEPIVLVDVADRVARVTLNRPQQINALSLALRTQLPDIMAQLDADPEVRVILLHGAGPRGFCAGADIREFTPVDSIAEARAARARSSWTGMGGRISKPIIAAIHGYCLGGGLEIALACDIRIASPDARFGLPEVNLGQIPGGGGTQLLPRTIGLGPALDLLLTGDHIDAAEARRLGLISRISSNPESLLPEAQALAARIAAKPPIAVNYAKEAARSGYELDLASGLQLEGNLFTLLMTTEDRIEAASAFREKRAAVFSGR